MTQEQFLQGVRNLYLEARKVKFSPLSPEKQVRENINRCTSHAISSEFEDLLAQYCYELIGDSSIQIFIDPQMTFPETSLKNKSGKRTFLYRPDIVVLKNNEIVAMIDAKTDLGYKRTTYLSYFYEMNESIKKIAGQKAVFKRRTNDEEIKTRIADNIKLTFFVAANKYLTSTHPIDDVKINEMERINVFFLSKGGGQHLNNYNGAEVENGGILLDTVSMANFDAFIRSTVL